MKQLLGLSKDSPIAKEYGARYPELQIEESVETGTLGFKSNSFVGAEAIFTVEELLAMELKSIKSNAENMAGKGHTIEDAVVTIPGFFTAQERTAIATAVELAGLRPISLLSDGLAVGLNYATSRTFPVVNEGGKPELHLVYDVGAGSASATVLKFQGKTVKDVGKFNKTIQEICVLGSSWDKSLGGDALNRVVLDDMIAKFIAQPASQQVKVSLEHVKGHGRTLSKMWKESERIRQVLSANSEAHANFEGLYSEDLSFKYKLTRSQFETLTSQHQDRVEEPAKKALEMAKLDAQDLDSIILHGGAIRTPSIQRRLENIVSKDKIRTNVNSDEAAVLGAGFRSATISPSFRVKEIKITDIALYPVFASWKVEGKEKTQKLFVPTSAVGPEKQVSFNFAVDSDFTLTQQTSEDTSVPISKVKTHNLTESIKSATSQGCAAADLTPKFNIRLSPLNGLPEVVSASISCETQEPEKKGVVDGMKDFLGFGSKKDDQKVLDVDEESSSTSTSSLKETKSSTESGKKSEATGKPKEAKKRQVVIPLSYSSEPASKSSISTLSLQRIKDRLTAFDASDRSRILRAETLNTLEAYTYKIRDLIEDEAFVAASTAPQRDEISKLSSETSSWLYDDGAEATREVLKDKLDLLRGLVKPVQRRLDEEKKRPDAIKKVEEALKQAEAMRDAIKTLLNQQSEPQVSISLDTPEPSATSSPGDAASSSDSVSKDEFADLDDNPASTTTSTSTPSAEPSVPPLFTENDLTLVEEKRDAIQKWLDEKLLDQGKLSPTDDPVLLTSDLKEKVKDLEGLTDLLIRRISAPKAKKSKPAKAKKSSASKSRSEETESSTSTAAETGGSESATPASSSASSSTATEPNFADPDKTYAGEDAGQWSEATDAPHPGQLTAEEELRIRQEQMQIDEELAAERSSRVSAAKASQSVKDKKAKATAKSKSKSKSKGKSKPKSKSKTIKPKVKPKATSEASEGHGEL